MQYKPRTFSLALCLLLCGMLLSSCTNSGIPIHESDSSLVLELPPIESQFAAPIGDTALEYTAESSLYLPMHDGSRLITLIEEITYTVARPQAESLVRALLNHPGNGSAAPIGGKVKLSLYGANPVEVSRDVASVNLAASALQLDRKAFYLACQAIANTLTTLPGIHYVNVLVVDKQQGLDIAGTLPSGTFTRSIGENIGTVFEQLLTQRASGSIEASAARLSSTATLYFPVSGMDGLLPEARSISFESQSPAAIVLRLLQELGAGPQQITGSPALPLLSDLLTQEPTLTDAPEGGGRLITLHFAHNLDDMLAAFDLTRANSMASICYTLTGFLPNIAGVRISIGDTMLSNVRLNGNPNQIALLFQNAIQRRADYAAFMMDLCPLYFADEGGQKLVQVWRPVPYHQTTHPRALLLELAKGPLPIDSVKTAKALMPADILEDSDLLGFSLKEDALLAHFTNTFDLIGEGIDAQQDRLLAYGLVNTLSSLPRIRRVCFFVSGAMPAPFSGEICWEGDFYQNLGMVD